MIRNIIWDADGTLFDTYPAIASAFKAALADLGKEAALDWIESLAKKSVGFCQTTLAEHFQVTEDDIERKFVEHYDQIKYEDQPAFPGVAAICEYICSIGGKNVIVTHRRELGTAGLLAANRMTGLFAGYLTNDDGYPKKPDPAAFEAALREYGLERAETISVGDREIDVLAGRAAGLFTCLFGAELDGVPADLTISNFDELYRYIVAANSAA
jgi:phosphoglycolate phosphatase-like HAD superfamily hydrolase